jgi:hypothetical protein
MRYNTSGVNKKTKMKTLAALTIPIFIVWSWVLVVDATKITNSPLVSNLTRVSVLLLNTAVSVFLFYQVILFLRKQYKKNKTSKLFLFMVFVTVAFTEWFVAWFLSFIWFGQGASIDSVFPFASLSPIIAYTPLRFLFIIFGFYGTSALVITIATGLILKKQRRYAMITAVLCAALLVGAWLVYKQTTGPAYDVTITSEKLGVVRQTNTVSDLVIFPEYGLDTINSSNINKRLQTNTDKEVFFVGSQQRPGGLGIHNTLLYGSNKQGIIKEQSKTRLIAGGEYLPYTLEYALRLSGQSGTVLEFLVTKGVIKDSQSLEPITVSEDLKIGAAVCSSIISPEDYRRLTGDGSTILTNSASLGVFGGSRVYRVIHNGMARFMATANARPFVQSAQDEAAYVVDHQGNLVAYTEPVSSMSTEVVTNNKTTPYTLVGEWPVYAGVILIAYLAGQHVLQKRKSKA